MQSPHMPPPAEPTEPAEPRSPARRYETSDVRLSAIMALMVSIFLVAALTLPAVFYLLSVYRARAADRDPRVSPLVDPDQLPPLPRLQSSPNDDYAKYLQEQQQWLQSTDWVDRPQGRVRMPIARAKDLILERGLPEPTAQDWTGQADSVTAGEENRSSRTAAEEAAGTSSATSAPSSDARATDAPLNNRPAKSRDANEGNEAAPVQQPASEPKEKQS